jgi:hypothetical protein
MGITPVLLRSNIVYRKIHFYSTKMSKQNEGIIHFYEVSLFQNSVSFGTSSGRIQNPAPAGRRIGENSTGKTGHARVFPR